MPPPRPESARYAKRDTIDTMISRPTKHIAISLVAILSGSLFAAEPDPAVKEKRNADRDPKSVSLQDDPQTAMKKLSVTQGLKIGVFASEPQIQDVVSFAFDGQGRVYVVETGRRRTSVFDIRKHRDWTDADLSFQSVDDRVNFLRRMLVPDNKKLPADIIQDRNKDGIFDWRDLEVESERIRLVEDTNGDHVADRSGIYADGFNTLVSGVAAGILAHNGNVYFTCIPDLWMLRDSNGDGVADSRTNLHHGFGVHIAYGGHDMHGLKLGPDGRIYFSIADRGTHLVTKEGRTIHLPHTGAIFRCNPDGTQLEVVASGLRNPQELAFDNHGNLFTGDNNADGGDKARWEHVVEGADYGWRYGWQHLPKLGAWNSEHLWELAPTNSAAYLLPPVAHISHGPAGIAYYPGTGLPHRFDNHFFLSDFPGGVRYFETIPAGASFTVDNPGDYLQNNSADKMDGKLVWGLYPTDIDFAPGGGAYVLDWVQGWEKTGKGRLYRIYDEASESDPKALETKRLLAEGMTERPVAELISLLGHADQRVRISAQHMLADIGGQRREWKYKALSLSLETSRVTKVLAETAMTQTNQLSRIHATWALGQIARQHDGKGLFEILPLLEDSDPEIRSQMAKVCGDAVYPPSYKGLVSNLKHPSQRVQFYSAEALGKLGRSDAVKPLIELALANDGKDRFVRHAIIAALVRLNDRAAIMAAAHHASKEVRMVALQVMRRMESPEISLFLHYPDTALVNEAARAINDVPITNAAPKLAALMDGNGRVAPQAQSEIAVRRIINTHFRLGQADNARSLAAFATQEQYLPALRVEALESLGEWPTPSSRDHITGLWQPLGDRNPFVAGPALEAVLPVLLESKETSVRIAALNAIGSLGQTNSSDRIFTLLSDKSVADEVRAAALRTLSTLKSPVLPEALKLARTDSSEIVRKEAGRLAGQGDVGEAVLALAAQLSTGSTSEKQTALESLGAIKGKDADKLISQWMDKLLKGTLAKELFLDVLEAARKRTAPSIKEKVTKYEASLNPTDELAKFRDLLFGGDAKAGRQIFYERAEAGCFRCHKVSGEGGEVGPELSGILTRHDRNYVLESILYPNKQITTGYESLLVVMKNGTSSAGILKSENETELVLNSQEDGVLVLKKADIQSKNRTLSPMPEGMAEILTRRELRDIVEFICTASLPAAAK